MVEQRAYTSSRLITGRCGFESRRYYFSLFMKSTEERLLALELAVSTLLAERGQPAPHTTREITFCPSCGTGIPATQHYCWPCFRKALNFIHTI